MTRILFSTTATTNRCATPNFGRRHRHVLLPKLWVRLAESEGWGQPALLQQLTWPSSLSGKWPMECQFLCDIGMQTSIDIHEEIAMKARKRLTREESKELTRLRLIESAERLFIRRGWCSIAWPLPNFHI
jgi:hypothetical protein